MRPLSLAIGALLLLPTGLIAGCTGQEHKEVVDVGERTKEKVERINKQLEKRAKTIAE